MQELCPDCLEFVCECPAAVKAKRRTPRGTKVSIGDIDLTPYVSEVDMSTLVQEVEGELVKRHGTKEHGPGRGPSGKLRNFGAMSDQKLKDVYRVLMHQSPPDNEAYERARAEIIARGLVG